MAHSVLIVDDHEDFRRSVRRLLEVDGFVVVGGEQGFQLVIVPADGNGSPIPIGPAMPSQTGGATAEFSPDGTHVLAYYNHDQSSWLLEADGSGGEEIDWNPQGAFNWQRLAP